MKRPITAAVEQEVKLSAGAAFVLPELPGEPLEPRTFSSTYFDTRDRRLMRHRITLRRRDEGMSSLWQLKLPHGADRLEVEVSAHLHSPPQEILDLLVALLRGRTLDRIALMHTYRTGIRVRDGDVKLADVTIDRVDVPDHPERAFTEVEVELVDGDPAGLAELARTLERAGAMAGKSMPKIERVAGTVPAATAPPDLVRGRFDECVAAILSHDPGTRLGVDAEELHQLRVATRRLRGLLRGVRDLVDRDWADGLRAQLGVVGAAVGQVRDLDVLIDQIERDVAALEPPERAEAAPLLELLQRDREEARTAMLAVLNDATYLSLLDELEDGVVAPARIRRAAVRKIAADEFRKLRKAANDTAPDAPDAELHALRIRVKRARYAAELVEATDVVAKAKIVQDVLGEHQDAVVAAERIGALAARAGGDGLQRAAEQLVERGRQRQREARAAFPAAWAKLERAGRRTWE
jgi:CHAD domain-containing protein